MSSLVLSIKKHLLLPAVLVTILVMSSLLSLGLLQHQASAANAKDFNPGRIIDDAVFYNGGAMNASQVQAFLNSKNPNCDTNGTQPATDWGRSDISHATLASYIRNGTNGYTKNTAFHAPPYTCLKDYKQNTPQMEAASGLCAALPARTNRTSAQIIDDVAKACGINPQVLIILLQKEQSLVTDNWPLSRQYKNATGFACPDTAPCNPAYDGFFYQVYHAARQFKVYRAYPNTYNYIAGRTNRIYWHPDLSRCGSSQVYIQNQATAALYIYTPYRPNQAALNNLYGTGNSCSSYGNRNFWRMFVDWFGSTQELYRYNSETLVGQGGVINRHTNVTSGVSTLSIGGNIYTFYGDGATGSFRLAQWNGSNWSDRALDGAGSNTPWALNTISVTHIKSFEYQGKPQVFYYDSASKVLRHAFINSKNHWAVETLDGVSYGVIGAARDVGSAISGFQYGSNGIQLYYYNNTNKRIEHTWWDGKRWRNEVLDGAAGSVIGRSSDVGSAISAINYNGDIQLFYYEKATGELLHTRWSTKQGAWGTERMDGDTSTVLGNYINAGKEIETTIHNGNLFVAYYDDATNFSNRTSAWRMAYWNGSTWIQNTLDGGIGSRTGLGSAVPLGDITLAPYDNKSLQIFYKNSASNLGHLWIQR